jgi:hypothetical protein
MTEKQMTAYVYFIEESDSYKKPKPVKIGLASDPQKRLANLQVGNSCELKLVLSLPCKDPDEAGKLERSLHWIAGKRFTRIRGEWFQINGSYAKLIDQAFKSSGIERPSK